ncbi:MAG: hypothetical protein ABEJ47_05260, partial [Halorhabdus sp.]
MTTRALERVDDWETRSFTGGYRGVHELADQEFSGVIRAATATLGMLNGTVVGVLDGSIEDFEDADGTAYVAPTPALPLLAVMQERSDEVRAKYYTEDTPLSKVDKTLEDGGFTGFVELSENVLSGDYYVVYHGGRSMSVAFVGERGQLLTEDEAFERADDEVGIYEVRPVEIDVIDVPEPEPEPTPAASGGGTDAEDPATETDTGGDSDAVEGVTEPSETGTESIDQEPPEGSSPQDSDADTADERASVAEDDSEAAVPEADDASSVDDPSDSEGGAQPQTDETEQATDARSGTGHAGPTDEPRRSTDRSPAPSTSESHSTGRTDVGSRQTETSTSHPGAKAAASGRPGGATPGRTGDNSAGDASDLEVRTIPSLDPSRSWGAEEAGPKASTVPVPPVESDSGTDARKRSSDSRPDRGSSDRSTTTVESQSATSQDTTTPGSNGQPSPAETNATHHQPESERSHHQSTDQEGGASDQRVRELEETIEEREARIDDLEARVETVESKREELETERDELESERDQLREELSDVREQLESLKEERDALEAQLDGLDVGTDGVQRRMSRQEAIEGTNLFVRYGSKSAPTLAAARESGASQSDVRQNLSVEYHTQFEVDGTLVEGQPFEEFLRGTMAHQFVTWVVTELLFEIRDTGHRDALSDLYDALPHVDRVELDGSVGVEFEEDGQTKRSQESFDVVFRDRMGNPLLVANVNDSRQAATENQMNSLVTAATRVGETSDSLAGAMFVTSSFFEPAALETTAEATGGGLLSRDKRESFVKLSRKQGYHLCLVEARDDQFHMAV